MLNQFRRWLTRLVPPLQAEVPEPAIVFDNRLLSGKNVLITGAGQNIGRAIALEMAQQGANIFFTELNAERRDQLIQDLQDFPITAEGFFCNSAEPSEIDQLCDTLADKNVMIDILVNNAGVQVEKGVLGGLTADDWQQTFQTNLFGPIALTKRIAQTMQAQSRSGSILFITSIHQWENIGWTSYSSSKAALGMIIKELAVELAPHGIRVNGIAPGWVAEDAEGNPYRSKYSLLHQTSIKPQFIGRAALFLAVDYFSHYTTGSVLTVDAGMSLCNFHVVHAMDR